MWPVCGCVCDEALVRVLCPTMCLCCQVNFFARVVGYLHKKPVTPSKFSFFLNALSALVTEVESSNLRWVTTNQGTTWVPESACVLCVRRLHHSSPSALEAVEHLLSKLPRRPPRTSVRSRAGCVRVVAWSVPLCAAVDPLHVHTQRSDPGTKSSPREFVDLDVFLDAMTEVRHIHLSCGDRPRLTCVWLSSPTSRWKTPCSACGTGYSPTWMRT